MSVARLSKYVQFTFTEQLLYGGIMLENFCPLELTIHSKLSLILPTDTLSHALFNTCLNVLIYSKDF